MKSRALRNIWQLGVKELRGLGRDPMMMILLAYALTISVYTAAKAMPETLNRAPIAIVDEDQSRLSARIAAAFYPPCFTLPRPITLSEMDARMDAGMDTFALDIPPGFERDVLARRSPSVQLNVDATRMSQAFTGAGHIQAIVAGEVGGYLHRTGSGEASPVDLVLRSRFNPELDPGWFGAITEFISHLTMLMMVLTGAALIREREHGTVEHLLAMPVSPFEIMVSKIWSMGLVVVVASALSLYFVVRLGLGVPIHGSATLFMAGTVLQLFATACLGIFLATVAGSMPQFGLLMILVLLPLQVLSGTITPRECMPPIIQHIMWFAPNTHYVMLAQAILFRGAGFDVVWPQLAALLGIGLVLFGVSLRSFRRFLR